MDKLQKLQRIFLFKKQRVDYWEKYHKIPKISTILGLMEDKNGV